MPLFKTFREDLSASLVVFLVALPLCLGIALASGAPLMSGLIAGIVGGIVAGSVSGSPLGVSGPAAGLAVIVLASIENMGFPAFLMAVVLAGVIQVGLGLARAGTLGNFFPSPVIKGMLTGIGIIIILKQLPHAVGFDADFEGDEAFLQADGSNSISALGQMLGAIQPVAVFISLCALAILVLWDKVLAPRAKIFRLFPGALAAVLFGVAVHLLVQAFAPGLTLSAAALVNVPVADSPIELFSILDSPDWSMVLNGEIWFTAAVIAVVASLETLLSVEAIDKLDPLRRKTPASRELLAQGASNIVSGVLGGLPVTQVIVRSSANVQSGAQSKLSAILHGFLLLILVLAIPGLLNLIPLSVLAAVLIVTGYKLAKPALFLDMYRRGSEQFVPFVATIAGVVLTDLLIGISIGMTIAILTLLYRNYRNSHMVHMEQEADSKVVRLSLCEEVSFLNKSAIVSALESIPDHASVVLDASRCYVLDNDVAESLREFLNEAHHRHINVQVLCSESPLVKPRLDTSRVYMAGSH